MEACNAVEREVDKVLLKFGAINEHAETVLRDLINHIESLKKEFEEAPPDHELTPGQAQVLKDTMKKVRETAHHLATEHRELHSTVSKVGKAIDRNFNADFGSTSREDVFSGAEKSHILNQVICQHFYRHGMLDIAAELAAVSTQLFGQTAHPGNITVLMTICYVMLYICPHAMFEDVSILSLDIQRLCMRIDVCQQCPELWTGFYNSIPNSWECEAGMKTEEGTKEPFTELNYILDCLKQRNLEPALAWAKNHREALLAQNSSLEFKLHRLHFIRLVQQGPSKQTEAIMYARQNLTQYVGRHGKEVQALMGTLLYLPNGIQSSPYSHLLDPTLWLDIHDVFTREACTLLGLSVDSPLSVCINAGCTALPTLLNIKQVMQQRQVTGVWNGKDELPIEIDLGKQSRYHSVFACPILRQQSTENNPPMKLVCGHVISRDALNKLTNANKLKCPYCPVEQNPEDARLIYF
ncbi:Protein RMD5 like protein A [Dufourea novaeangliae]|uniref:Protein RMD5 like protein A n=2 Tax=Apocrita TaxID=7400 RepID=A0A154PGY1_DUFNO|nr:Protein RMD5 like protein A [Dufourea novaeangliae]